MQDIYQCTRCGTGWLAKRVEPRGQGWSVRVFVCSHCRYASQPGVRLAGADEGGRVAFPTRGGAETRGHPAQPATRTSQR